MSPIAASIRLALHSIFVMMMCAFIAHPCAAQLLPTETEQVDTLIKEISEESRTTSAGSRHMALFEMANALWQQKRAPAVEVVYKKLVSAAEYSPAQYLEFLDPPLWFRPSRASNFVSFLSHAAYPELTRALVEQGKSEEALTYTDRSRSRIIEAVLQKRMNGPRGLAGFKEPDLESIRRLARESDATLVVYSIVRTEKLWTENSPFRLFAWVVRPDGQIGFKELPAHLLPQAGPDSEASRLQATSERFQATLPRGVVDRVSTKARRSPAPQARDDQPSLLRTLHEVLIEPIRTFLPVDPDRNVVVFPDEEIFLVPFNALMDADGKYLIERHSLSVAPSLGTFALLREKAKRKAASKSGSRKSVLVVGDPVMPVFPEHSDFEGGELPQLSGAVREARSVAQLFGVAPLLGADAREDIVVERMKDARIIHFATHGLLTYSSTITTDMLSASASADLPPGSIALAPGPKGKFYKGSKWDESFKLPFNGFLASGKILLLDLDADLVVLSACDTARGRTNQHQFVGLPSAFIAAGADSVLITLWSIPDQQTAALMSVFYRELLAGTAKPAALRRAILASWKISREVKNWGAFTLMGLN